jgi:predicted dehydrogenase/threonine dehydrogenase-like Zn-dependent dehydrogenase
MKQVVQSIRTGQTRVRELPDPLTPQGNLLIATVASLISAGTERYVVQLAQANLLSKARQRPDHLRRILEKVRAEGLVSTARQVREKLDEPMPLGYSSAGVVIECGAGVSAFKPGDRVAVAGPHASLSVVGQNLCAPMPESVSFEQGAYAAVGAIALQGIRLARVTLGERVLVVGLGLIGQITVALLKAHGCTVFATDVEPPRLDLARTFGADALAIGAPRDAVRRFSDGIGVDAAIITAATNSNEPVEFAADACRTKGRIVLVGVVGMTLPRPPFFQKELEFTVSSSLGAGRGDASYEEKGIDYPIGYARWTARRNMQAVLEAIASAKVPVERLTTHRFSIDRAAEAYQLITSKRDAYTGVLLEYGNPPLPANCHRISLRTTRATNGAVGVSVVGAGNFSRLIMLPVLARQSGIDLRGLCTAKGLNAVHSGEKYQFAFATTDVDEIFADRNTSCVFVMTRHNLHADLVLRGLRAGKNVFVEKPLCVTFEELARIETCIEELGDDCPLLMVGFNRRFAPAMLALRDHLAGIEPLSVTYRFAAGELPTESWPNDSEVGGGRIVGEACHAIDACAALVASPPVRVYAESVAKVGGVQTTDDRVFITLRHANGSISNIAYQAGGARSGPTERLEVFGGGCTATVEGWDTIEIWADNHRTRGRGRKDKGHANGVGAFIEACKHSGAWPIGWAHLYATTWASLAAVQSLRTGLPVDIHTRLG